jgi:uncharacterized membrane protein HdeD (DUF308 family)
MTSALRPTDAVGDSVRTGVRQVSGVWWWFLILGILWTALGMFVLSYRVGSLAVVVTLVGVAFLFGGIAPSRCARPAGGRSSWSADR